MVDLGSNTIRLSAYNVLDNGDFDLLFSEKEMAGIVNYINEEGLLSRDGIDKACAVLAGFRTLLGHFGMSEMHVFATASLRNIRNTDEAVHLIRRRTGLTVDVISGETEAKLGYYGAMLKNDMRTGAMFDIGGGSTEILECRDGEIEQAQSLAVGSLNLFNECVSKIWPKKEELKAIIRRVEEALESADLPEERAERACGIGGTARAVLKISNAYFGKDAENRVILPEEMQEITELLCKRNDQARKLIVFTRGGLLFAFNFGSERALLSLPISGLESGDYDILLSTDSGEYGGFERIDAPFSIDESGLLRGALSERTAVALKRKEKA